MTSKFPTYHTSNLSLYNHPQPSYNSSLLIMALFHLQGQPLFFIWWFIGITFERDYYIPMFLKVILSACQHQGLLFSRDVIRDKLNAEPLPSSSGRLAGSRHYILFIYHPSPKPKPKIIHSLKNSIPCTKYLAYIFEESSLSRASPYPTSVVS